MADIGILTKNYKIHLDNAIQHESSITFYSNARWVTARNALIDGRSVVVYFVVDGGSGIVEYQGILKEILLAPFQSMDVTKKLLSQSPDSAALDELNKGAVKTLYSVTRLQKLKASFSQTKLLKLSDGKHISEAYNRGYCVVNPLE